MFSSVRLRSINSIKIRGNPVVRYLKSCVQIRSVSNSFQSIQLQFIQHKAKVYVPFNFSVSIRSFSTHAADYRKKMQEITDSYSEAKMLLKDAEESKNTVYLDEDVKDAQDATEKVIQDFEQLIKSIPDSKTRREVQQTIGLKIEEIKAQLNSLIESLKEE